MTSSHLIYIPLVVFGGMVLGFFLGGLFARDRILLEQRRAEQHEAARQARAERREKRKAMRGEQPDAAAEASESS